jgi:hypothetical protein
MSNPISMFFIVILPSPPLVCNDATCHPSEKQVNPIFGNLVYETKLYLSHEISLVCIRHNRHEIDSNSANNACSSVMISKYL